MNKWQTWNVSIGNRLLEMKPTVGEYQSVVRNIRKEEVVFFAQICISHTRVIHSYLQLGEERPQCIGCNSSFVIPNILLEYDDFSQVKKNISMLYVL